MSEPTKTGIWYYPDFPSGQEARACSIALNMLGRPWPIGDNDVSSALFEVLQLPDGRGAIKLDLDYQIIIHKDGVDPVNPFTTGTVAVLLRNFAGQPAPEEIAGWLQLVGALQQLPERGDPELNGMEPVIRVRLGDMLPASAAAALLTQEQVDALFAPDELIE